MSRLASALGAAAFKSSAGLLAAMGVLAAAAAVLVLGPQLPLLWRPAPDAYDIERMVLVHATLPRLAMALLCGAALGASGALLQQALRNPLASPTTLGIDAGARLALALATLFVPTLFGWGRDVVALGGSCVAAGLVFALSRRQDFAPVALILSGLIVSLYFGALAAVLTLVEDRYLASLFVWGSGSLSQQGWEPARDLALRLAVVAPVAILLVRPLSLLDLGDEAAGSLGLDIAALRLGAVALAVLLAAFTASAVGVIGFVGLVAPILVRLAGTRGFGERLAAAAACGALLLVLTDLGVQALAGAVADFLPTGAVTALLGSPVLLWLLPRVTASLRTLGQCAPGRSARGRKGSSILRLHLALVALVLLLAALALLVGRSPGGAFRLLAAADMADILPFRWPRVLAAATAGVLLGTAGFLLQRLTANEMASPEILGISAGATFAMAVALFAAGVTSTRSLAVAALLGSGLVLAFILALARRSGFVPERMLLGGVALSALLDAVIGVFSATGDPRAFQLLGWITGSAQTLEGATVLGFAGVAAIGVLATLPLIRWLDILPLGAAAAQSLGVPLGTARLLIFVLATGATAAATPLIGPLTFVGLIAPHLVRLAGLRRAADALLASALTGAAILVAADWLARTIVFPFQLPTGLVASLVGAPVLLWLLQRRAA